MAPRLMTVAGVRRAGAEAGFAGSAALPAGVAALPSAATFSARAGVALCFAFSFRRHCISSALTRFTVAFSRVELRGEVSSAA